jgi:secreted trypsin-like serine protease
MTGGIYTNSGQFPSVVSIQSPYNIHCIGNIVHPQHILTSARCVLNPAYTTVDPRWITIVAGDRLLAPRSVSREVRNVTAIFVHENFNTFTLFGDLAILRLDQPFVFPKNTIEVARRSTRIVPVGTICHLAGWGTLGMV